MDVPYGEVTRSENTTPLVSRNDELKQLDAVIDQLRLGTGPVVIDITGEAGIGKSRLMSEFCRRARNRGVTVLRGRATEYEPHTPFQPFTDAFADLDHRTVRAVPNLLKAAAPILHRVTDEPSTTRGHADRFGLYRATAELLAHIGRAGLLVALDDLHWADPASLELLDYLIRHPVRGSVLFAIARRDRQTSASLAATLARGVDTGVVLGLDLRPLTERECVEKLAADLPRHHAADLYAASEGNPLYFLALLHARRAGAPIRHGFVQPHGPAAADPIGLPAGLGSLLLDELKPLTSGQRGTVETIAVLGDATRALLGLVSDRDEAELDSDVHELARRDLVRSGPGGRWTLRHPVIRALVYEAIDCRRRTEIHWRAAAELGRAGASAAERAHHIERSLTTWDPDATAVLIEAAEQAAPTAPATSAHWLEVVLRLLPHTPEHAARRGELTLLRARALGVSGGLKESRGLLHEVISAAGPDDAAIRAAAVAMCAVMERHLGRLREAAALLRRELSRRPGPSPQQAVSLGLELGSSALFAVSYPEAREDVRRTLAAARSRRRDR